MDVPVNAEVYCADGECGRSTYVIIDPVSDTVSHIVVKPQAAPYREVLVPVTQISESTPRTIHLRCRSEELSQFGDFIETEYVRQELPAYTYAADQYLIWPYHFMPAMAVVPLEHQQIAPGQVAVVKGAEVEATDGRIGRVDEFLIDPVSDRITHLVLREGHLWGQRDVTIPVDKIDLIEEDVIFLKLSKQDISELPAVPAS